jgi:hypothetical protein
MRDDLQRRLEHSGRFGEAEEIDVVPTRINDFGEGEYEARFTYPRHHPTTGEENFLVRLKRALEDELPGAWVAAFTVSSRLDDANEVAVTFDYLLPPGAEGPAGAARSSPEGGRDPGLRRTA